MLRYLRLARLCVERGDGGVWHLEKFCAQPEAGAGGRPLLRPAAGRGRRAAEPVPGPLRGRGERRRRGKRVGGWVAFLVPPPVQAAADQEVTAATHRRTDMFSRCDMVAEGRRGGETGPAQS